MQNKQTFLRSEIVEKGYDEEKFADYLSSLKDNAIDLDTWSMDSLEEAVENFQAQNPLSYLTNSEEENEDDVVIPGQDQQKELTVFEGNDNKIAYKVVNKKNVQNLELDFDRISSNTNPSTFLNNYTIESPLNGNGLEDINNLNISIIE